MTMTVPKDMDPAVRRRNRILLIILLAAVLAIAAGGVMYFQEYGFETNREQNRYH